MKLSLVRSKYLQKKLLFLTAALLTLSLVIEHFLYGFVGSLSEDIPRLYGSYALRSINLILLSAVLVLYIYQSAVQKPDLGSRLALSNQQWTRSRRICLVVTLLANLLIVFLLFFHPVLFSSLAREDALIETLSALFFFIGSAILTWQTCRIFSYEIPHRFINVSAACFLAIIFFIIAMEEVSWFQRVVEFETPDTFASNLQGEFNFHNFATKMFENAFYMGGFVWLIGLPFLKLTSFIPRRLQILENFTASAFTLCASCVFVAYNYHYWNGLLTQIAYFVTFFILISLAVLSRMPAVRGIYLTVALTLLAVQTAFFVRGETMPRLWDATEYKEFFLAFGFLLYAFDVIDNFANFSSKQPLRH